MIFSRTYDFNRDVKKLAKKYPSIFNGLEQLFHDLDKNPFQGDALGDNCFKIRMAITSKGKGKNGGARVITCIKIENDTIHLLTIFDKSEIENISDKYLDSLRKDIE